MKGWREGIEKLRQADTVHQGRHCPLYKTKGTKKGLWSWTRSSGTDQGSANRALNSTTVMLSSLDTFTPCFLFM